MITYFLPIVIFIIVVQVVFYLANRKEQAAIIHSRLKHLKPTPEITPRSRELIELLAQKIINPLAQKMTTSIGELTPQGIRERIQRRLLMAGRPGNISVSAFLVLKVIVSLVLGISFFLLAFSLGKFESLATLNLLFFLLGFFVPDFILRRKIRQRQEEISKMLPYVIDLLTTAVEAGVGFQTAMSKVVEKAKGPLITEFSRVLREIQAGRSTNEALRNMGKRVGSSDLQGFISAVAQAKELGVSMANVLSVQAQDLRINRRQRAQEAALKAPVKIIFPLVLFILPALLVVILGPVLINLFDIFRMLR